MKKCILTIFAATVLMGTVSFAALANGAPPRFHGPAYEHPAKRIAIERSIRHRQLERREWIARKLHECRR